MNISDMHVWFRQYAQQMGMQNVRVILPEQIDILINTSIADIVNQIIRENVGLTNDRVITDNSKIGQINALRNIYKVIIVDATSQVTPTDGHPFQNGEETNIRRIHADISKFAENFDYMYIVDFSINYTGTDITTNYFPVRLIDDAYLADTLNDFILKPRLRTPIAVIYDNQIDIYLDELKSNALPQGLTQNKLRVSYIAKPAKVAYVSDLGGENVDCDLPEYMHIDILKHAVDLYRASISGGIATAQAGEQAQNQENARNNYRNEGYQ